MRAVFLDRDGVINENRADHVKSWAEFRFLPGALDAIARLTQAGRLVFIVSNQAIINRGLAAEATVDSINRAMAAEVERHGGRLTAIACCPHRAEEHCGCRKPRPGLIIDLMARYRLEPGECVMIGDALSDVDAGRAAGLETILVRSGRGREQLALGLASGRFGLEVAADLADATDRLLRPAWAGALSWQLTGGGE